MTRKKTVLAIDDDPDILNIIETILSPFYEVKKGESGKQCLDLISVEAPDLIVLDVMMTHLGDGLDCVRSIKDNPATKNIPVIMMTSVDRSYDYRSQIDTSFFPYDRWLDKPIEADILLKTVRELIG